LLEDRTVPAVFEVNTLADTVDADPAVTSLREAITAANTAAGDDSITFAADLAGTINLQSALPDLSTNIAIWGPGADLLEVRRDIGGDYRIVLVTAGDTVVLSGLKISNGNVPGSGGAGISNSGTLTVTGCTVSGNSASFGGGIYNGGTLTVTGSTVSGNSAVLEGGGIFNGFGHTLTVTGSTVSGNSAATHNGGGGIFNSGTLTVTGSTVSGNSASSGSGGGIYNFGTLTVTGSTVSGNSAGSSAVGTGGGGIFNTTGTLTLSNTTLSGNSATHSGGGLCSTVGGSATLTNVTITANRADADNDGGGSGGGIRIGGGTLTLHNTLVAGNFRGTGTVCDDVSGPIVAASSFNLIGDGTGLTGISDGVGGNQIGAADAPIDPRLGPLANNGGLTLTHALLTGSPALDRAFFFGAPATDQRGVGRFGAPDIGAFELPPPLGVAQVVNATGLVSVTKKALIRTPTGRLRQRVTLVNTSAQRIQGPISLVLDKLTVGARLWTPTGRTKVWAPLKSYYLDRLPADGILDPGDSLTFILEFVVPPGTSMVAYKTRVLAGKGLR
jgi:CSLREA domain-containing protein